MRPAIIALNGLGRTEIGQVGALYARCRRLRWPGAVKLNRSSGRTLNWNIFRNARPLSANSGQNVLAPSCQLAAQDPGSATDIGNVPTAVKLFRAYRQAPKTKRC